MIVYKQQSTGYLSTNQIHDTSTDLRQIGRPPKVIEEEIGRFFADRAFGLATMVAWIRGCDVLQ